MCVHLLPLSDVGVAPIALSLLDCLVSTTVTSVKEIDLVIVLVESSIWDSLASYRSPCH